MRRTLTALAVLGTLAATTAAAQDRGDIELTRQQIQTERQAIVAKNLQLTDEQGAAFWPLFREYRAALAPIGDRSVKLLQDYAAKYGSLTDADAEALLKESQEIQKDKLDIQKKYVGKFQKVLPAKLVARYYQIENKLDAIVNYSLAADIPLVE